MKRIILFLATNLAVIALLSFVMSILGVGSYLTAQGLNYQSLLIFAALFGFTGSFISLAISKMTAKWSMGLQVLNGHENEPSAWLVGQVGTLAIQAGIKMPEVCLYEDPVPNAFATGPSRNNSLVAVSTGLMNLMSREEVRAVLAHEIGHIKNGDMVTMTLLQGVLNTFVIFAARVVAYFVQVFMGGNNNNNQTGGLFYMLTSFALEIVFGLFASLIVAAYSRRREFKADAASAELTSPRSMISALQALSGETRDLTGGLAAFAISGKTTHSVLSLFATHPPIEKRIEALSSYSTGRSF